MDSGHFFLQSSYIQQDYQFIFIDNIEVTMDLDNLNKYSKELW